jgi:hypothetical protein
MGSYTKNRFILHCVHKSLQLILRWQFKKGIIEDFTSVTLSNLPKQPTIMDLCRRKGIFQRW